MIVNHPIYHDLYKDKEKFIILVTGGRGCEDPNTPIMMYDHSIRLIKDIRIGDRVMGDDGTPREVLNTVSGRSTMYRVHQSNGEDYIVNDAHILTLFAKGKVIDVPIKEYLANRDNILYKGVRVNFIDFSTSLTDIQVTEVGEGNWCGMILDGNHRYCHSDGTVTHNSGKSFAVGAFIERLTFELGKLDNGDKVSHQMLYTRYTMTSAEMSVIPEFMEKIEFDGTGKYFHKAKSDVVNVMTGSRIMFRGIKTSSGNQTAKLKSIKGITTFICDEAEEWTSEDEFEKIMFSIRQQGLQNRIIIIMNPSDSNHFVYRKYIKDTHKLVEYDGVPVQISTHPNVLHIHTSFLDNKDHLAEQFLTEAAAMKERDPERYGHIFMGRWADVAEGAIFKKWGIVKEFPKHAKKVALAMDFGYTCFSGDTLITTKRGDVPIRDVVEGDFVLTRKGYRRVNKHLYNGRKRVVKKRLLLGNDVFEISATKEHNFNINGTWKKYGELMKGDKLFVLLNSEKSNIGDIRMANTPTITTTSGKKTGIINKDCFIMQYGSLLMEEYLMAMLSIISTKTHSIMTLATSCWLRLLSIVSCMKKNFKGTKRLSTQEKFVSQRIIGKSEEEKSKKALIDKNVHVSGVEKNTNPLTYINYSAEENVEERGNLNRKKTLSKCDVSVAESLSIEANTRQYHAALKNVQIYSVTLQDEEFVEEYDCDVYDLGIDGVHEYFANGILVHNCDPTAIVKCGVVDNALYIDELCYQTGMLSRDIIKTIKANNEDGSLFVYSESADPRLIDEIGLGGVIIYPVQKGPGSIMAGIDKMLTMDIYITERSINAQDEFRNYVWAKDKEGQYINMPEGGKDHIVDSCRYFCLAVLLGKVMKPKNVTKERLGIF